MPQIITARKNKTKKTNYFLEMNKTELCFPMKANKIFPKYSGNWSESILLRIYEYRFIGRASKIFLKQIVKKSKTKTKTKTKKKD